MFWKPVSLFCLFAASLLGEGLDIKFEKFAPGDENYWREFFESLELGSFRDFPAYSPRSVVFTKGPETGWSGSIGGGATFYLPLFSFNRGDFNNGPAHRIGAHEFCHLLQMVEVRAVIDVDWVEIPVRGYMSFVPDSWAEGLAEIFASRAGAMMLLSHPRSRAASAPWLFEKKLGDDLALRYAMQGGVAFQGPFAYHLKAFPLLEMEKAVGDQFFPALHRILRNLSEQAAKAGPPYRLIRQDQILDELERAFPGVLVHGLPLRVYLSVQPAFAKPAQGEQYFLAASASWYANGGSGAYLGQGPVNPNLVDFNAWKSEVVFQADDPSQYQIRSFPLTRGKFRLEIRGIASNELFWSNSVDLSATPGGQRFTFTNPLSCPEGRYRLVAKDEKGTVVAESIFAVTAGNPLLINPVQEGWMHWERNPVLKLSGNDITLSRSPARARQRASATVQVSNLNPTTTGPWGLDSGPERIGQAVWNWDVQDTSSWLKAIPGQGSIELEVLPGITTRQEGVVCFQSTQGTNTACRRARYIP